ncbi:MAG: nucleotide exchange factor GrpE [Gemmatimonadetes bacterium]|nr:nucleotide exchange factor GrpE [Gemmatimonadota bacterium]MBI3568742.1 nucleotide exchange factor GrpE [Gemmatimonadota bacterium]
MTDQTDPTTPDPRPDGADLDHAIPVAEGAADAAAILGALDSQLAEQKDKYLRLAAEYDNFRKRTVRERQGAELKGMELLIRGILDPLDDLGRFAHVDPSQVECAAVVQGAEMVEKKLLKSLAGHGLELVNPAGEPFDPAVHEAISTMPAASADEDHLVAQVYQVGYVFNGMLLRPARVVVKQWSAPAGDGASA